MTWSIKAIGTKHEVKKAVEATGGPSADAPDRAHYDRAKDHILGEVDAAADDATCSVDAFGHADAMSANENITVKSFPTPLLSDA